MERQAADVGEAKEPTPVLRLRVTSLCSMCLDADGPTATVVTGGGGGGGLAAQCRPRRAPWVAIAMSRVRAEGALCGTGPFRVQRMCPGLSPCHGNPLPHSPLPPLPRSIAYPMVVIG